MKDQEINLVGLESIEIRPVINGFLVTARTTDGEDDYVFDSHQKTLRFVKKAITPVE